MQTPNGVRGYGWVRSKPQTLQGVGVCETPNPKRRGGAELVSEATKPLKRERRVWVPCETLNPKTAEWLRKIQTLKGVGECKTLFKHGLGVYAGSEALGQSLPQSP